jgi:hypothetical protein
MKEIIVALVAFLILALPLFAEGEEGKIEKRPMPNVQMTQPDEPVSKALPGIEQIPVEDRENVVFWVRLQSLKAGIDNPEIWLKHNGGDLKAIAAKIPEDWEPNPEELKKAEEALKSTSKDGKVRLEKQEVSAETPAETPAEAVDDGEIPEAVEEDAEVQPGE